MHVPVIMVTALDQPSDKVQGLEAGADDFLTKPVDDIALITRVKNLARLKTLNDEMLLRMATGAEIGAAARRPSPAWSKTEAGGRILLVEDQERVARRVRRRARQAATRSTSSPTCRRRCCGSATSAYDLLIVSLNLAEADGLRLCSQVRSLERTRHLPIIVLVQPGDEARLLRALDMGVNDYLTRPIDRNELLARVRTQIKRKRHSDHLRDRLDESVELAVTDALTGLHNRRYMETHLKALAEQAQSRRPAALACCSPTSTTSSRSTTPTATTPATTCCASSPRASAATRAASIWPAASAARSSSSSCPTRRWSGRCQVGERLRDCIAGEPFQANRRHAPAA